MEDNFLIRLWNRIVYTLNQLLGEEPDDMLLQQQAASYQRATDHTYNQIIASGGRIGEMLNVLASNEQKQHAAQADLDRSVKQRQTLKDGTPEAALKDQEIAMRAKMVSGLNTLVTNMKDMINRSRTTQGLAELSFKNLTYQRDLANSEAGMSVDEIAFAKMRKAAADAQLAAAGILHGASQIKDNRGKLKSRAAKYGGQADVADRMAKDLVGFDGSTMTLNANEQAVLDDAMRRAGVSPASADSKSASAS